jgi:hypothetical protein|tara:strand:- start:139 stop:567 length:429 start_codon:yes stop_codon:yes gene_type:complete
MSLIKARAAFENAILTSVNDTDPTVNVIFDNMPFSTPGRDKKYVMVNLNFSQATTQPQGAAQTYYAGSIRCGIMTPPNRGSAVASAVAQSVITGLVSINSATYVDKFAVSPRVSEIEGPTAVTVEGDTHFLTVVSCDFTANA